jgi:hypothetical protein
MIQSEGGRHGWNYILYCMTLSFGKVGLGCLTPLSTIFQLYRHIRWRIVEAS